MPLGELEEEEWHKVLLIGTEKLFNDRMKELLPENEDFKYELRQQRVRGRHARPELPPGHDHHRPRPRPQRVDPDRRQPAEERGVHRPRSSSAWPGEDEAAPEKLNEYGFNDVFKKPFDVALLGERIRTAGRSQAGETEDLASRERQRPEDWPSQSQSSGR